MNAEAMHVMEHIEKRKWVQTEFEPKVERHLKRCIKWLEAHNRTVTPRSLQDISVTLGMAQYGVDTFIIDIYNVAGRTEDYAAFLKSIGYAWKEEENVNHLSSPEEV